MEKLIIGRVGTHPTVCFAAEEIKRILSVMDPSLEIRIADAAYDPDRSDLLWVGRCRSFGFSESGTDDVIIIETSDEGGMITGSNPRSVLIAAYRFLRELGCRFVRPGREGEIIPQRRLEGFGVRVRETASYPHRGVCIEGAVSCENVYDMIDFLPKVGMNEYFIQFAVPAEFFARWYERRGNPFAASEWGEDDDPRSLSAEMTARLEGEIKKRSLRYHKVGHGWTCEPFGIPGGGWDARRTPLTAAQSKVLAEVNGKRELWGGVPLNTNLCYSDAAVRGTVTDAIVAYAKDNPQVDVIHFWLADGENNHCECAACRAKRPADWYVRTLNELDAKLTAAGLDTKIVFLIYVDLLWEPETERIQNPDRFILMFAPITRNYGQNYGDFLTFGGTLPPYERNRLKMPRSLDENIARLRRWQEQFDGDSFDFDYHLMWAHVGDIGYEKCARNVFEDMKDLQKIGLRGMVSCQIQRCFLPTALPFVAMAAALWNRDADFDATADDWYSAAFGEKGAEIRAAMRALSASCRLYEKGEPFWDEKEAVRALGILTSEVKDDPSLSPLGIYAGYLARLFDLFRAVTSGDKQDARAKAGELFDYLWKNEPAVQPLLDVHNTVGTITRWMDRTLG